MDNFKFNLLVIVVFVVLGGVIYWSVSSMNGGIYYTRDISELEPVDEEPVIPDIEEPTTPDITNPEPITEEKPVVPNEYSELISKISKLITDKVYMKKGSQGTRVGTVQEFLNVYFNTDKKVDNDYGDGTLADVKKFQTAEGLTADGQTGPETYQKMIDWLENK